MRRKRERKFPAELLVGEKCLPRNEHRAKPDPSRKVVEVTLKFLGKFRPPGRAQGQDILGGQSSVSIEVFFLFSGILR